MAGDGRRPETIATIQKATMIPEEGSTARPPRVLRTNADDRLPIASLGRVEGGDGFVEGSHVADVCPQPTIPVPLDDLTQLGAIGYDLKSIVRPPEGRASVGPAMVTSVPPARIPPADRFAMSPPRTSNTRSPPPISSRASLSRSTNSCAPKSRAI